MEEANKSHVQFPADSRARKEYALYSGLFAYFPAALAEVARVSFVGQVQHVGPNVRPQDLRWMRDKSTDHADALLRHLARKGLRDVDGVRETAKVAWRALALLQEELEQDLGLAPSPASTSADFRPDGP